MLKQKSPHTQLLDILNIVTVDKIYGNAENARISQCLIHLLIKHIGINVSGAKDGF